MADECERCLGTGITCGEQMQICSCPAGANWTPIEEGKSLREALCLIKLACLGTSVTDGWTADRIISCVIRLCIDAGIKESYRDLGTDRRYEAITLPHAQVSNRVQFALADRRA